MRGCTHRWCIRTYQPGLLDHTHMLVSLPSVNSCLQATAELTVCLLMPAHAHYRAYRGMWFGTEVCVKILDLHAPLSPAGGSSSTFPTAPLLEAALSKALLHPNIVGGLRGLCCMWCALLHMKYLVPPAHVCMVS